MNKRSEFVNIAKSQIGVKETGTNNVKYNTWYYGRPVNGRAGTSEYAWCVTFECWCANQVGILNSLIPKCNNVGILRDWYKTRGLYHLRGSYTPQKGDLIIFRNASHTGIVERVESGRIWTIEGNSKDKVSNNIYLRTDSYIQGYCEVKFSDSTNSKPTNNKSTIVTIQMTLNNRYKANIAEDGDAQRQTFNALRRALQIELNRQYNAGLKIDGVIGPKTKAKLPIVKRGAKGNISWLIQACLICKGYNIKLDGDFGEKTENAVIDYQRKHRLKDDGEVGKNTFEKLFNL